MYYIYYYTEYLYYLLLCLHAEYCVRSSVDVDVEMYIVFV